MNKLRLSACFTQFSLGKVAYAYKRSESCRSNIVTIPSLIWVLELDMDLARMKELLCRLD